MKNLLIKTSLLCRSTLGWFLFNRAQKNRDIIDFGLIGIAGRLSHELQDLLTEMDMGYQHVLDYKAWLKQFRDEVNKELLTAPVLDLAKWGPKEELALKYSRLNEKFKIATEFRHSMPSLSGLWVHRSERKNLPVEQQIKNFHCTVCATIGALSGTNWSKLGMTAEVQPNYYVVRDADARVTDL